MSSFPFTFFFNQEKDKPVIVMVGNKAVVPKGRDAAHNRRKPTGGHRAAMPSGTHKGQSRVGIVLCGLRVYGS